MNNNKILITGLGSIGQRHVRCLREIYKNDIEIHAYRKRNLNQIINDKLKNIDSIQTLGGEVKLSLLSFNSPILFLSHGVAQTLGEWKADNEPNYYIQFSLVNPF